LIEGTRLLGATGYAGRGAWHCAAVDQSYSATREASPMTTTARHTFLCLLLAGACNTNSDTSADHADAGSSLDPNGEAPDTSTTDLSGTLGALGEMQPTLSSFVISNSGETLIYLSSQEIDCALLMKEGGKWLASLEPSAQVIEIVVRGTPKLGTIMVGMVEVNYAGGGKSSAYEKNARSGSVTFTLSELNGPVEGVVEAGFTNPIGDISGSFHAEFCKGGQQY
jgi:hypothetical protein